MIIKIIWKKEIYEGEKNDNNEKKDDSEKNDFEEKQRI